MKIVHIITSLGDGGAEQTLYKICKFDKLNTHFVISIKGYGKYYSLISNLGVKIYCLNINFFSIKKFFILVKLLISIKPDIVQTWLVHGDFIGSIASRLAGIKNIVWNIRYSNFKIRKSKLTTILILKILAKMSKFIPKLIIVNSKRAKKIYINEGYDKNKLIYIFNGFDLKNLKLNKSKKINFKKKYNLNKKLKLIGNAARFDPKKDHMNLLKAISLINQKNKEFFCILAGTNIDKGNAILFNKIKELKLNKLVKLIGQQNDINEMMSALDIYVQSSSFGEGFPNVIAEAMASETPCVVTNVGDSKFIVGQSGWVVEPNDPFKLASAIEKALNELGTDNWKIRAQKARSRIEENFDINKMIKLYNQTWKRAYTINFNK